MQDRQVALVRLLLAFTSYTHTAFLDVGDQIARLLRRQYRNPAAVPSINQGMAGIWREGFAKWREGFERARYGAVALAFGELAQAHRHFMSLIQLTEAGPPELPPVFEPQAQAVLDAANRRVYDDGLDLSQRLWRLDQESYAGIQRTVIAGVTDGKSAWELAQDVEQYLGANEDCPRWTRTRLYGLTKADIAGGDTRGLLTGSDCDGRGVAYNALRLARTEISYASQLATRDVYARSPWVIGEKFNVNAAHGAPDICDDYATGGNGKGEYAKGDLPQGPPLHPHCLCFITSVQMADDEFRSRMRGWLEGGQAWPEMDEYSEWVGSRFNVSNPQLLVAAEETLLKWRPGGRQSGLEEFAP